MKKSIISLLICLTVGISGVLFTSCKDDIPTIDYVHQSSYSADFSALIDAINDQTITLSRKLDLINEALVNIHWTLEEKLGIIQAAIEAGVGTYEEYAKVLIESINQLNKTQEAKLQAICDILESNNANLTAKLADIEAAIEAGIGTYEVMAAALIESIDKLNATQDEKLQAIYDILKSNNASLTAKLADIEAAIKAGIGSYEEMAKALIESIDKLNATQAEKLQAIYDVLKNEFASLDLKVEALDASIDKGFADNKTAIKAFQEAIVQELNNEKLDLATRLTNLKLALDKLKGSIDENFKLNKEAISTLTTKLIESLESNQTTVNTKIENITNAIGALTGNIGTEYGKLLTYLVQLIEAVKAGADYSEIIAAIKALTPIEPEPEPEPEPVPEGFVDLGLSVYWAECNLGAEVCDEPGGYYGWGMKAPYEAGKTVGWNSYFKSFGGTESWYEASSCGTSVDPLAFFVTNGVDISSTEWDAAALSIGGRIPTKEQFEELLENCDMEWDYSLSMYGCTFTSKLNGKSIFLPAAGYRSGSETLDSWNGLYYITATPKELQYFCFYLAGDEKSEMNQAYRYRGFQIRPVQIKGR